MPVRVASACDCWAAEGRHRDGQHMEPVLPREPRAEDLLFIVGLSEVGLLGVRVSWWPAVTNYLSWNHFTSQNRRLFEPVSKLVFGEASWWCVTSSLRLFFLPFGGQRCLFGQFSHWLNHIVIINLSDCLICMEAMGPYCALGTFRKLLPIDFLFFLSFLM